LPEKLKIHRAASRTGAAAKAIAHAARAWACAASANFTGLPGKKMPMEGAMGETTFGVERENQVRL
jgi:hypothetical protein